MRTYRCVDCDGTFPNARALVTHTCTVPQDRQRAVFLDHRRWTLVDCVEDLAWYFEGPERSTCMVLAVARKWGSERRWTAGWAVSLGVPWHDSIQEIEVFRIANLSDTPEQAMIAALHTVFVNEANESWGG